MNAYEQVGGARTLRTAVDVFYRRVLDDPATAAYFQGIDLARLSAHQRAFLTAVLGGPDTYAGRDLFSAHAGLDIDDQAYDAVVEHLLGTLRDLDVPADVFDHVVGRLDELRPLIVAGAGCGELLPGHA